LAGEPAASLHEEAVGVPVVAAFEFQDLRAARRRARDAQRRHDRLGARRDEPDAFDPRHVREDPLGQLQRVRLARSVRPAVIERGRSGGMDDGITVAQHERTEALAEVDVRPAVDGDDARAGSRAHVHGRSSHTSERADRTVHPAGRRMQCAGMQLVARHGSPSARAFRAPYETMKAAPARRSTYSVSSSAASKSANPFSASASRPAYSPLTWKAPVGTPVASTIGAIRSIDVIAGFTISRSAPSSAQRMLDPIASSRERTSIW